LRKRSPPTAIVDQITGARGGMSLAIILRAMPRSRLFHVTTA
jgi:hypothetical protein